MNDTKLCALDDIPLNGSKGFTLGELRIFAVRRPKGLVIYRNACPHLGIPLEWVDDQFLDASNSMIQCANHAALFVIDTGKCVAGPCSGKKLEAIPFHIHDNHIFIRQP